MHRSTRTVAALPLVLVVSATLAVTGCATTAAAPASSPGVSVTPTAGPAAPDDSTELGTVPQPLPGDEVVAQGLVLDAGAPVLCLGDVGAASPPQCGGIPIVGWDWDAIDGWEQSGSTRWGSYAVQGTWDGETFRTSGEPISLALYDPVPVSEAPPTPGSTPTDELERIQRVLHDALGDRLLSSHPADGYLEAAVVFDDGALQEHLDGIYGTNVVHVTSAMREVVAP